MMDARAVFIDTNVLVYASVVESPFCLRARGLLKRLEAGASELWVSRQVIREFLAQLTCAPQPEFASRDLVAALSDFEHRYCVAEDHALVTHQLVLLVSQVPTAGKQLHDANIVATMLAYDIPRWNRARSGRSGTRPFHRSPHQRVSQSAIILVAPGSQRDTAHDVGRVRCSCMHIPLGHHRQTGPERVRQLQANRT